MNPFILKFADGTIFFIGLLLVVVTETFLVVSKNRIIRSILRSLAITGIILVVIFSTPLPIWAYVAWAIPAIASLILFNHGSRRKTILITYTILCILTAGVFIAEARHRCLPQIEIHDNSTIYVIGDSISAGMGTKHNCWPAVLNELTTHRVINLAQPGATVEDALKQALKIIEPRSLIIIEIGGNDLLGTTDVSLFHEKLDALVTSLYSNKHQVLIVELPLFPFQNAFGKAQRTVAKKHNAKILPKRYFTQVLGTYNGTLDGLHLSQEGHDKMADIMLQVIQPE